MGLLSWIKGPEHAYQGDRAIRTVWKGDAYTVKGSGYSVQACLGMSDKGYHSGLAFTAPNGESKTTWHRPVQRRDHAMEEAYSTFNQWTKGHEIQVAANQKPTVRRAAPSWER